MIIVQINLLTAELYVCSNGKALALYRETSGWTQCDTVSFVTDQVTMNTFVSKFFFLLFIFAFLSPLRHWRMPLSTYWSLR